LGPSPVEPDYSGSSTSSAESGDEEVSPPRFTKPADGGALADLFSDMTFGSFTETDLSQDSDSESFTNFDFTNTSNYTASRKVFADRYDGVTDPEDENIAAIYHQVYVIEESSLPEDEASEDFDDLGNPYIDPADLTRGIGPKYVGPMLQEKVQLPQAAWDRAQRAMDGTEPMTTTVTPEVLQAYQYKLARAGQELEKQRRVLEARKATASTSRARRAELNRQSRTSGDNHRDGRARGRSRLANVHEHERENLIQNLGMSFMSIDTRGHIIPKTPEAGYLATHAFMLASKPPAGDPREALYNMAMAGVGIMGTSLQRSNTP
jgi:hypothetical protein